jgi:hypothetical protein
MAKRFLIAWALLSWLPGAAPAAAQEFGLGASCAVPPERFAVEFFQGMESAPVSPATYESGFAYDFKRGTPIWQLQEFVASTHARFGIDRHDRPLGTRLVRPPQVTRLRPNRSPMEYGVTLWAFTARGVVRQVVEFLCEQGGWRVMRFAYEPDEK